MQKPEPPRGRVIDFQKVKDQKKMARRRNRMLIVLGALLVLLALGAFFGYQIYHAVVPDGDFWGNFGSSSSQEASMTEGKENVD